jgi:hypothetical protein
MLMAKMSYCSSLIKVDDKDKNARRHSCIHKEADAGDGTNLDVKPSAKNGLKNRGKEI